MGNSRCKKERQKEQWDEKYEKWTKQLVLGLIQWGG